jgi:tryptophan synthase alpha chain
VTVERIESCFRELKGKRAALVAYLCVGDPNVEESLAAARAALDGGADILELGVPFSDPTADGPVIAAASYRAIRHGGSLRAALEVARQLREDGSEAPFILFSYYNPIFTFGDSELPKAAAEAGIDGVLVVDLPPEEGRTFRAAAADAGLAVVPLIAPTSGPDRERAALEHAKGFVYYVSVTGVTGSGEAPLAAAGQAAAALAKRAGLPVAVGFGIDSAEKARLVADQGADAVVVGTALVRKIVDAPNHDRRVDDVTAFVSTLRKAIEPTDA